MQRGRRFGEQRLGALILAALVLVPLSLGAHRHDSSTPSSPSACPVCLAVKLCPAVQPAPAPVVSPPLTHFPLCAPAIAAPVSAQRTRPTSRGPPPASASVSA